MKAIFILFLTFLLVSGCSHNRAPSDDSKPAVAVDLLYAKGFEMEESDGLVTLRVMNPWQQAENVAYQYWLGKSCHASRKGIPENRYFKVPVEKVVCLSTTFIGFIDFLHQEGTIIGISGEKYVTSLSMADKIRNGGIPDVGYDENLSYEKLIQLQPDVVFVYGITGSVSSVVARLDEVGIKTVVVAEYLEETPLAKMEWIKYFGAFFDLTAEAGTKFDSVALNYNNLAQRASREINKPKVLLGLPWSGSWYISGGNSYMACILRDAGGYYLWNDLPYKDSQPVSLEKVFEKAFEADFWLNAGDAGSKADILQVDPRFSQLKAYRNNSIYNNNNLVNARGGNAYFEKGVVEPDIILSDIVSVIHPHLLPSYGMKYYRKLD
jgi:iron complex transport system substrate-binding protein